MNHVMHNAEGKGIALPAEDISELRAMAMTAPGIPKVLPAAALLAFPFNQRMRLMVEEGLYVWPTLELAKWLAEQDVEMEIGAGNGAMAEYLGALGTDNYSQAPDYRPEPKYRTLWEQGRIAMAIAGQAFVTYGQNVARIEAMDAVIKHKPSCVYGLFITHKYRAGDKDGNVFGVDEEKLIRRCRYIMVGNAKTHANKRILALPHEEIAAPWLITRGYDQALNRIWVWEQTR